MHISNEDSWDDNNSFNYEFKSSSKVRKRNKESVANAPGRYVKRYCDDEANVSELQSISKKTKLKNKKKKLNITECKTKHNELNLEVAKTENIAMPDKDGIEKSLLEKLRDNLQGPRFRFINEDMYVKDSHHAVQLFQQDPEAFNAYHVGYQHQQKKWPFHPLKRIIRAINKMPKYFVIADMGCGEGKLARSTKHKVYSIDLMSTREGIIASDMAKTPLESNSIDVVVYCLSLMGTNLKDFFLEANRVVKVGGLVKIAEIASRFDDVSKFVTNVESCGFELSKKDTSNSFFYFFDFQKNECLDKNFAGIREFSLKPCLYKKR